MPNQAGWHAPVGPGWSVAGVRLGLVLLPAALVDQDGRGASQSVPKLGLGDRHKRQGLPASDCDVNLTHSYAEGHSVRGSCLQAASDRLADVHQRPLLSLSLRNAAWDR